MKNGRVIRRNTFSIKTLGCKLNQYESECIRSNLEKIGFEFREFYEKADFYIINTCTVTGKTDARSRNAIRRARRKAPDSVIITTGCYVESNPRDLEKMDEINHLINNKDKSYIPYLLKSIRDNGNKTELNFEDITEDKPLLDCEIDVFHGHSRAFIKIQDGCDAFCSYCIIPYTRGRNRSVAPDNIISQIKRLVENGYEEIVLTGIHIGRYGENSDFSDDLVTLIKKILKNTEGIRIRFSSIEPTEVTSELIKLVSETNRVAPHFHIPLQSGDNNVLKAMKRPYTVEQYIEKTTEIVSSMPDAAIGTDIIVGFPGETDENFKNTCSLIESELPINYLHVFSYSDRPGTKAESLPGKIAPETRKKRSRELIEIGKAKKKEFLFSQKNRNEIALVQEKLDGDEVVYKSITGNYCEIILRASSANLRGKLVPVKFSGNRGGVFFGEITGEPLLKK
ncbi:MAG: tRNA (N(6)-L-threonylcarbamoyladenosine(37)-C(2))-methylthiotransferase MtaB [Candidatus Krumholzibacteriota bacterium]|nr:tRNA (N(6)-L-threonylcarbamoyladenosine(37)-C(2))-methylthiotransferase MtaB [Candidatus Krumholzibacteriota bacterium]